MSTLTAIMAWIGGIGTLVLVSGTLLYLWMSTWEW